TSAPSVIRLEPEVIDSANSTIPLPVTSITTTAQPPGTTSTTTPQAPPTATITTAAPQTQTSSYTLVGGVVTISYSPGVITFVSAIPQPGFSTDRTATGPDEVRIRFESESHTSDFHAEWKEGELKITKNETGQG
ncbi:MAG: hypothetical protein OEY62_09880, partial [Acidimicrobiia bacterium]|nr:hypothetical protein [Acidimicrobiia bacterium]